LSQEEPLALDKPTYGTLVHELLRLTTASLESKGGFAAGTRMQVELALAEAASQVALDWELTKPLPPSLLWQRTLTEARDTALSALTWPMPKFKDQTTYVEVPFGGLAGGEDNVGIEMLSWTSPVWISNFEARLTASIWPENQHRRASSITRPVSARTKNLV
jgi:hypothetical protein